MGKKKKKKSFNFYGGKSEKKKKDKSGKSSKKEKRVGIVHLDSNIKNSEAREALVEMREPVKAGEKVEAVREKCNHQVAKLKTVAELLEPGSTVQICKIPMLNDFTKLFGENNVYVCPKCWEPIVADKAITSAAVKKSILTLYAAAQRQVSSTDMKNKEIKALAKAKHSLIKGWIPVLDTIGTLEHEAASTAGDRSDDDISALNRLGRPD